MSHSRSESNTSLTVVVHGATGSQGLPVVKALLAAGHHVRGLARTPSLLASLAPGAEPVAADLADANALATAYAAADAIVVQLPLVFDSTAIAQAETVLKALALAGVPRVVVNLGGPVPPGPVGHPYVDARVLLRDGVLDATAPGVAVGPALAYADNLALPASARRVLDGTLAYPLPAEVPVPWLATSDLADLITELVGTDERCSITLAGPAVLTGPEAARAVGAGAGRQVEWQSISPNEYREMLHPTIGVAAADGIAAMYAAAAATPPPAPDPHAVPPRTGTTDLATWASQQDWDTAGR